MIEAQVVGFDHNIAYLMPVRQLGDYLPVPKSYRLMVIARLIWAAIG